MLLRLVLVSAVAGLGVLPPARGDVAGWTRAVQTWLDERLAGCNTPEVEGIEARGVAAPEPVSDPDSVMTDEELQALLADEAEGVAGAEATADSDFAAVLDEWVSAFVREQAAIDAAVAELVAAALLEDVTEPSVPLTPPSMAFLPEAEFEPFTACEDVELAASLDWEAELYGAAETIAAPIPTPAAPPAAEETPAVSVEISSAGNSLGDAVRLTREALAAWLNLLQSPALVTISH